MTAREETIVLRDAVCVYLEGSLSAYQRALKAFERSAPNAMTGTVDDWLTWYGVVHRWLMANAEQTQRNFELAEQAEQSRTGGG